VKERWHVRLPRRPKPLLAKAAKDEIYYTGIYIILGQIILHFEVDEGLEY